MRPFTRTIIELFDGKKRYLITLYQRQYAWNVHPQLEMLWGDIERAADKLEQDGSLETPHFMGAMVISLVKTFGKQVQAFEVIDGQQRLTTFQLLLAAFRETAAEFYPDYEKEISKYLLNDGVMEIPVIERFKLWPSLVDRSAFTKLVDPDSPSIPPQHLVNEEDGELRPAISAQAYLLERIRDRIHLDG